MTAYKKELLVVACLVAFVSQRVYADPLDVLNRFNEFDSVYTLPATVTKVTGDLRGDLTVTFHAAAEAFHAAAEADCYDKEISEDLALRWTDRERPVPFTVGMVVVLYCDRKHQIVSIQYEDAGIVLWRKRQDGFIEVVLYLKPDKSGEPSTISEVGGRLYARLKKSERDSFIRVFPNYVALIQGDSVEMIWKHGLGLAINLFGAGSGEFDASDISAESSGLPIANEPGVRIRPGKDGWHRLGRGKSESVPFSQQITPAGCKRYFSGVQSKPSQANSRATAANTLKTRSGAYAATPGT
jgi:hypothetical protein